MISSMTAFAKKQVQDKKMIASWEIRSVNNRFLDVNFRMPEAFRDLELKLRSLAKQYVQRGKVDCSLRYDQGEELSNSLQVNATLLEQLNSALSQVCEGVPARSEVDPLSVLRWPGMLVAEEGDLTEVKATIISLFEEALKDIKATRGREGSQLAEIIKVRLDGMSQLVDEVKPLLPEIKALQQQKLINRFKEAEVELEAERLAQEMVHFAQKIDVMEEIDRLETHIIEMHRVLDSGGMVGRRLDFLTQELNREANTLGSKSVHDQTTKASVELKVLIEQIREQVQNIE